MSNEQEDRWYVQFDSQEVRLMTLDELDEAFQKGLVHEETYVIPVGASDWQTLGDILGGDDGEPEAPEAEAPPPVPAPSYAAPGYAAAGPARVANTGYAFAPMAQSSGVAPGHAPVATLAPTSSWPPAAVAPSQTLGSSGKYSNPLSVMPVVQDVPGPSYDIDAAGFKPKKTKLFLAAAVGLAAIGGIGVAIARLDAPPVAQLATPTVAAAAISPPAMTRDEPSPPTPAPAPAPVAATPAPSENGEQKDSASGTSSNKLSDDMKKALLASDQDRTEKKKSRSKAGATRRASVSSKGSTPFKSGGNANDPLNPAL